MKNMKKVVSAVLLVALVLAISAFASASGVKDFFTTGNVNMRTKANLNGKIVTVLPKGTILNATDCSVDKRGVAWLYGSYKGKTGWVSSAYLDGCQKITTGNVNMRASANLDGKKITALSKGVNFTAKASKTDDRGVVWYYGSYGKNTGWVSSKYLKNN